MKSFLIPLAFATAGVFGSGAAMAQSPEWYAPWQGGHAYIGAGGGQSKFKDSCGSIFDCDNKDTAWNVHLGGNFSHYLGLELGYVDFGKMSAFGGQTEAKAGTISLTAGLPIGDRFAVFAKGGTAYSRTDVSASPLSFVSTGHETGWNATYGVGATFAITPTLLARVDWDRTKLSFVTGDRDVDVLSGGLQFRF